MQIVAGSTNTPLQESKSQSEYYIQQIQSNRNLEENLWALTVLTASRPEIKTYVEKIIRDNKFNNELLSLFKTIRPTYEQQLQKVVLRTGSSSLLVALLSVIPDKEKKEELYKQFHSNYSHPEIDGIDYESLCKSIINGNKISPKILSTRRFFKAHFFLLYYNQKSLIPDGYYSKLSSNLTYSSNRSRNELREILFQTSLLWVFYELDEYKNIEALYSFLARKNPFPNSSLKLELYRYLDYSMYRLGLYDRSLEIVRNFTVPLADYLNKKNQKLRIKLSQGVYLYSIGKIKAAEKIYQEILNEIDKDNPGIGLSSLYNNLALTYHKLGKYEAYLDLQFQALKIAEKSENFSHQFRILNNLFVYYRESNNPQDALDYLEKAQSLAERLGRAAEIGKLNISMGSFYRKFEANFKKAHKYFFRAEKHLDPENNSKLYIDLLIEQAETFEEQKYFKKALDKYNKILSLVPRDNPRHLDALVNKALVNLKMGNTEVAGKLITKYNSFDLSQLDFEQIIKAKSVEADYLYRKGRSEQALKILNPALEQVVIRAKSSGDLKSGFWHVEDEYLDAFDLAVSIHLNQGQPGKAVEKLDQLKTVNNASLYQNPLVKSSVLNESELTQYKQLANQLDATRKKLLAAPEGKRFEIQQTISRLNVKKRQLDRKLSRNTDRRSISVQEVQNTLSARELVMHITELKDQYYIANISRSDVQMNQVPLDSTLRNRLSTSVKQIASNKTNLDTLYSITKLLGMKQIPDRIQKVTVIPDSYLYQLPIDVLPLTKPVHSYSYGETTYLIEKYRTQYLTSLNDFGNSSEPLIKDKNSISFVGYGVSDFSNYQNNSLVPLPFAKKEVKTIADKLTNLQRVQTFVNNASTKQTFMKTAPHAQILHMATHSSVSERDPMFSSIYMNKSATTPDSAFEDRIFAYELFELNLNNEMIMLNSCDSGSGSYIQGTGVMGISRALRYAGASSLVLNLWSVNDMMASDFAVHFYDQLNQGKSKAEALQATKQYFLQSKNASPHFWGPYMLIGSTEPIVQPNRQNNLAMAGTFILYFLLMVGLSYLKDRGIIFEAHSEKQKAA